jgi:hypothetical protein
VHDGRVLRRRVLGAWRESARAVGDELAIPRMKSKRTLSSGLLVSLIRLLRVEDRVLRPARAGNNILVWRRLRWLLRRDNRIVAHGGATLGRRLVRFPFSQCWRHSAAYKHQDEQKGSSRCENLRAFERGYVDHCFFSKLRVQNRRHEIVTNSTKSSRIRRIRHVFFACRSFRDSRDFLHLELLGCELVSEIFKVPSILDVPTIRELLKSS